jgi:hypothetical protein
VEPNGLTLAKGTLEIDWRGEIDKPSRRLVMLQCRLREETGWREVPPQADSNHRELLLVAKPGQRGEDELRLRVALSDDGTKVVASLHPSLQAVAMQVTKLKGRIEKLEKQLATLPKKEKATGVELNRQSRLLQAARAAYGMSKDRYDEAMKQVSPPRGHDPFTPMTVEMRDRARAATENLNQASHRFNMAESELASLEQECKGLRRALEGLQAAHQEADAALAQDQENLKIQQELKTVAERYQKLPVQVRLGMVIDRIMWDVARIGPE